MLKEIQYALRVLAKSPTFTLLAIGTLALAIGANTAVLSLVNGILVRPLPFRDPGRLVLLWEHFSAQGLHQIPVSVPEYLDYEERLRSFAGIAAFDTASFNLTDGDRPERIEGAVVTPGLFSVLGVSPLRGRAFAPEEMGEGRNDVVVISERLWRTRFDSDPDLLGRRIALNGRPCEIIGIMPAGFEFPLPVHGVEAGRSSDPADIWRPVAFTEGERKSRGSRSHGLIGRLRAEVTMAEAQAELNALTERWKSEYAQNYPPGPSFGGRLYPLREQVVGGVRVALLIVLAAVGLVLLIACANLSMMLLARAASREREMAIRVALGAGPLRLLRQLLTESVVLAVAGGLAGILLAWWSLELLRALGAQSLPRLAEVNLDWRVLGVTLAISAVTGIVFGLFPALTSARPELTEALKEGGRGSTESRRRNRLRNGMVVAEIALALVLLVSAGLLLKSFIRLQNVSPGFNPASVLTMELFLPPTKYERGRPVIDFYGEMTRRLSALPGVEAAAFASILPLSGSSSDNSFDIEGRHYGPSEPHPDEQIRSVTPDYFKAMQIPLSKGRFFDQSDTAEAPGVVIINQALARKYWPNEEPLGKRMTIEDPKDEKWMTVVGVVGDVRHRALDEPPQPEFYVPHAQLPYRQMILALRTTPAPMSLAAPVRQEVLSFDQDQPVAKIRPLAAVIAESVAPRRLSVLLITGFAGLALLLAAVGIYGVMSSLVAQRTHEIGVRMALGAQRSDIMAMVVGQGLRLIAFGAIAGLLLALAGTRSLQALLFSVSSLDLATFVLVPLALAGVALAATVIPAVRATRADPMIALTHKA